jgi:hypothetical protein
MEAGLADVVRGAAEPFVEGAREWFPGIGEFPGRRPAVWKDAGGWKTDALKPGPPLSCAIAGKKIVFHIRDDVPA